MRVDNSRKLEISSNNTDGSKLTSQLVVTISNTFLIPLRPPIRWKVFPSIFSGHCYPSR